MDCRENLIEGHAWPEVIIAMAGSPLEVPCVARTR